MSQCNRAAQYCKDMVERWVKEEFALQLQKQMCAPGDYPAVRAYVLAYLLRTSRCAGEG